MQEDKNSVEMGLSSINDWLAAIYNETVDGKKILSSLHDIIANGGGGNIEKPNMKLADSIKSSGPVLRELKLQTLALSDIKKALKRAGDRRMFSVGGGTTNSKDTKNIGLRNSQTTIQNQYQLVIGDKMPANKDIESLSKMLDKLHKLIFIDTGKLDRIEKFFTSLNDNLKLMTPLLHKAGKGFAFLTLAIFGLSVVSLLGIVKLVFLLPMLGFGIAMFVMFLVKALSGAKFFKAWLILRALPEILLAMGQSVLFLSIGLYIFQQVGWGAIMKLLVALSALVIVFRQAKDTGGAWLLISLAIGIYFFVSQLKEMNKVEWESVLKLPAFIIGLGVSLGIFSKVNKSTRSNGILTILSIGILLLAFSLINISKVSWEDLLKLNVFIVTLGLSLRVSGLGGKDVKSTSLIGFGLGILLISLAMASLAELNILAILQLIGVFGLLGVVINKLMGSGKSKISKVTNMGSGGGGTGLIGFAFGLAFMALAVYAFAEVPIEGMFRLVLFVAALGLALKLFGGNTRGIKGLPGFAFGLGLLVLAIVAFDEIPNETLFRFVMFIVGLGLAVRIFGGRKGSLFWTAFGIGLIVLALDAFREIPSESMWTMLGFLAGLGLILKFLFKGVGIGLLIALSFAIIAMAGAMYIVSKVNMTWQQGLLFVGFVVVMGGIMAIIGIPAAAALIALGAAVMILMAGALWLSSIAIGKISRTKFSVQNIWDFMLGTGILALGFAVLAIPLVIAVIGAALFIVVAISTILGAEALSIIGSMTYDTTSIDNFMYGVKALATGFTDNAIRIGLALIPAVLFIGIAISTIMGALALALIAKVEINVNKVDKFGEGLKSLMKTYDKFGVIQMGKAALKAVAMLPIMITTYLAALTLEKINKIDISPTRIERFRESFGKLIETVVNTVVEYKDKLKAIDEPLKAVVKIVSISSQLADVVQKMADLKFNEYEVVNGQLVLKRQRQLTEDDFKAVGTNIGILIEALMKPISVLGEESSSWTIGNKVIANPFKNNKSLKGMDTIKRLGDAYMPLADTISKLASAEMADPTKATQMTLSMLMFVHTFKEMFMVLEAVKVRNAGDVIDEIIRLNEILADLKSNGLNNFNTASASFIDRFSDDNKWRKIKNNVTYLKKEFQEMAKSINTIDIKKAKAFEENIKLLVNKDNNKEIAQVLENLKELIEIMEYRTELEEKRQAAQAANSPFFGNQFSGGPITGQPSASTQGNQTNNTGKKISQEELNLLNMLNTNFAAFQQLLEKINQKLGGTLKVKTEGLTNTI